MDWGIAYCRESDGRVPAEEFLDACPTKVEANLLAVLEVVRAAPPPAFSGGGKWEAMHGRMGGYYEIRGPGPGPQLLEDCRFRSRRGSSGRRDDIAIG